MEPSIPLHFLMEAEFYPDEDTREFRLSARSVGNQVPDGQVPISQLVNLLKVFMYPEKWGNRLRQNKTIY